MMSESEEGGISLWEESSWKNTEEEEFILLLVVAAAPDDSHQFPLAWNS